MKHNLAVNKQLFNVKDIAYSTTLANLAEGQFGIYAEGSNTSVASGTTFATLPAKFRLISKLGGKVYYSFDTIEKSKMYNQVATEYTTGQVNIWKGIIEDCDCIKGLTLKINLDEDSLMRRDGLTWTHNDFVVEVSPKELECLCNCDGKGVYDNHVMTKLIYEKVLAMDSPFYTAYVEDESGNSFADAAAIQTFIDTNKAVNTDDDDTNDSEKLVLFITGKDQPSRDYKDLDVNYIFPRGVRIHPVITVNNGATVQFEEIQDLEYEVGVGADLRAEEWENMNYYTNLNHYPQLCDGIASDSLVYQFENGTNYDTVTFEFVTDKVNKNDGDKRLFGVLLGAATGSAEATELEAIFVPA